MPFVVGGREEDGEARTCPSNKVSGPNATAIPVAKSNITDKSPTLFGIVVMIDDPLTEGPEPTSKEVGRAQGFYGSAGQDHTGASHGYELSFHYWKVQWQHSCHFGSKSSTHLREIPIVVGTGVFRLARGFAILKTYIFNATSGDAIVEYNVAVVHY
ncbi:conserved hypothetical protein [Ricinus communis]|uniref:Dirigent protein n=1 Tax=Ricinus communis TaxID=3988 RepID=B9SQL0_RICCO|nr:conserved hypothetical protein [Ricinus communis]